MERCCELVSKFCIFVVWNSLQEAENALHFVVNWFQNFVSLWSETVNQNEKFSRNSCELVSKFCIFVVWNSSKKSHLLTICCELVSKFCIFVVWNSYLLDFFGTKTCCELVSKFCIFVVWNSIFNFSLTHNVLWIGFKILYLCGLKQ